jgi:hypothetical protein
VQSALFTFVALSLFLRFPHCTFITCFPTEPPLRMAFAKCPRSLPPQADLRGGRSPTEDISIKINKDISHCRCGSQRIVKVDCHMHYFARIHHSNSHGPSHGTLTSPIDSICSTASILRALPGLSKHECVPLHAKTQVSSFVTQFLFPFHMV